jgi:hypothetical protein
MKTGLRAQLKPLHSPSDTEPQVVTVPRLQFLMIDGEGEPSGPEFQDAVGTLYGTVYTIKSAIKDAKPVPDYPVLPLEGLYWCDGRDSFDMERREDWRWTLLIVQPDFVTRTIVKEAVEQLAGRRGRTPALAKLRLSAFQEGKAVQMLHVGPYSAEKRTLERMHEFIAASGLQNAGKHHEIYLSDPRRTAAEKLKTILRQPVKRAVKVRAAGA